MQCVVCGEQIDSNRDNQAEAACDHFEEQHNYFSDD
jgi:hypothetical protein